MAAKDMATEERVRTTDMSPPSKKVYRALDVRIELIPKTTHARITSRSCGIDMIVPAEMVAKRFPKGRRVAFFRAQIEPSRNILEICDPLPAAKEWCV